MLIEFARRFRNPLVVILIMASAVSAFTGAVGNFVIIILIVMLSVTLDFVQEHRAGRAAERLRQSVQLRATVLRDGIPRETPSAQIAPGDVVLLSAGSLVPADGQVIEARDLFVNQALLTGEPFPVEKRAIDHAASGNDDVSDTHALFSGASIVTGTGRMLVRLTGDATRQFMWVIGPVSSLFDFLTFGFLLYLLHAHEALFQTAWFVESLATQVLIIFVIRTRGSPLASRPSGMLLAASLIIVSIALLPFAPFAAQLGFVPLPAPFYVFLGVMTVAYLAIVEGVKRYFYRRLANPRNGD